MNARKGFTLVELIVVTVLGALIIMASLQVLVTNQRTYTAQTAKIQGQQTTRAGLDILSSELREISAQGGDLLAIGPDSVSIRVMRKFGVVCSVDLSGQPRLTVIRAGEWFEAGDSAFVFADNQTNIATDDAWIAARVTAADTTQNCVSQPAVDITFSGQGGLFTADSVRTGAPVRSFTRYTYGLFQVNGEYYLGRKTSSTAVPMVGPVRASGGVAFTFMDANGVPTTTRTDVRQISITIRTDSDVRGTGNNTMADSITARIYTRN